MCWFFVEMLLKMKLILKNNDDTRSCYDGGICNDIFSDDRYNLLKVYPICKRREFDGENYIRYENCTLDYNRFFRESSYGYRREIICDDYFSRTETLLIEEIINKKLIKYSIIEIDDKYSDPKYWNIITQADGREKFQFNEYQFQIDRKDEEISELKTFIEEMNNQKFKLIFKAKTIEIPKKILLKKSKFIREMLIATDNEELNEVEIFIDYSVEKIDLLYKYFVNSSQFKPYPNPKIAICYPVECKDNDSDEEDNGDQADKEDIFKYFMLE